MRPAELSAQHRAGYSGLCEEEGEIGVIERQHARAPDREQDVEVRAADGNVRARLLQDKPVRGKLVAEHGQISIDHLDPNKESARGCGRNLNLIPTDRHQLAQCRRVQRKTDRATYCYVAAEVRPEDRGVPHRSHQSVLVEVEPEIRVLQTDDSLATRA